MPTRAPFFFSAASCASARLRGLSQVALTPVCETTTGRAAAASTSATVCPEAWARSTMILFSSSLRSQARPSGLNPPRLTPCAEPLISVSVKWVGAIMRKPAS